MTKAKVYFENLDALRTIAFLLVFSEHIWWRAFAHTNIHDYPFLNHVFYALFANGFMGVSIFFTLSGFLITYLILTEINKNGKLNIGAFYMRRTLRIWPLYFVVVIFVLIILPHIQHLAGIPYDNPANIWYYFTFLSNFDVIHLDQVGQESFLISGITWSLAIEEQFYLFWPLLFLVFSRRLLPFVMLVVIFTCVTFRFMHVHEFVHIYFHSFAVMADLAVGGLAAWLILYSDKFKSWIYSLHLNKRVIIYSLGILYLIFKDSYLAHNGSLGYSRLLSTLIFAFIILDQNFNKSTSLKIGKSKWLNYWGKYTYGLYLMHPIGLWIVTLFTDYFNVFTESFTAKSLIAGSALICTGVIAYISFHLLETPFLKLKDKFSYISRS